MKFFKKNGRANDEELAMIQAINEVIEQKGIPMNEVPECLTLDDLVEVKHLVDAYTPRLDGNQTDMEVETLDEETTLIDEIEPSIIDDNSEIEQVEEGTEPVEIEILEVEGEHSADSIETVQESSESIIDIDSILEDDKSVFIAEDYNPFEQPIIERSYTSQGDPSKKEFRQDSDGETIEDDLEEAKEPTPIDDNLDPRTKKRAAEQTADTILKGYARLVPKPFKWLAKVPEEKVEKLAFSGQLDLSIEVSEGVTFDDYMKQTNEQVDEIFEIEQDTLDEIREPLIEVLMEQQMELTPQQRLGMAVISHLMQMFSIAMKLRSQNNRILSYQKHLTAQAQQSYQGTKVA